MTNQGKGAPRPSRRRQTARSSRPATTRDETECPRPRRLNSVLPEKSDLPRTIKTHEIQPAARPPMEPPSRAPPPLDYPSDFKRAKVSHTPSFTDRHAVTERHAAQPWAAAPPRAVAERRVPRDENVKSEAELLHIMRNFVKATPDGLGRVESIVQRLGARRQSSNPQRELEEAMKSILGGVLEEIRTGEGKSQVALKSGISPVSEEEDICADVVVTSKKGKLSHCAFCLKMTTYLGQLRRSMRDRSSAHYVEQPLPSKAFGGWLFQPIADEFAKGSVPINITFSPILVDRLKHFPFFAFYVIYMKAMPMFQNKVAGLAGVLNAKAGKEGDDVDEMTTSWIVFYRCFRSMFRSIGDKLRAEALREARHLRPEAFAFKDDIDREKRRQRRINDEAVKLENGRRFILKSLQRRRHEMMQAGAGQARRRESVLPELMIRWAAAAKEADRRLAEACPRLCDESLLDFKEWFSKWFSYGQKQHRTAETYVSTLTVAGKMRFGEIQAQGRRLERYKSLSQRLQPEGPSSARTSLTSCNMENQTRPLLARYHCNEDREEALKPMFTVRDMAIRLMQEGVRARFKGLRSAEAQLERVLTH